MEMAISKKRIEPTYLKKRRKIKISDYLSKVRTNYIFYLSPPEQLLVNFKVGLVSLAVAAFFKCQLLYSTSLDRYFTLAKC